MSNSVLDTLRSEHGIILEVLDGLENCAQRCGGDDPTPRADLATFALFVRDYVDGYHHGKEESILFSELFAVGLPKQTGPLAVMLQEHRMSRDYLGQMLTIANRPGAWQANEREAVVKLSVGYVALQRSHIAKEENIIYPMAAKHLTAAANLRINEAGRSFSSGGIDAARARELSDDARKQTASYRR